MGAKWIVITVLLVVIIGAATAFGGYTYGHAAGLTEAQNVRNNFLAARGIGGQAGTGANGAGASGAFTGGASGQGAQGANRQFNANNFANGQVKSVSGNTVELSTATEVLKVQVTGQTQIQKMTTATVSDLQPGDRVTVEGTRNADGTFTAQAIQLGGGLGAFGGGARQAGQAGQGGQGSSGRQGGGAAPAATAAP